MLASEHEKITEQALKTVINKTKTRQIAITACMLSDAFPEYHDKKWSKQHFSGGKPEDTISDSMDYIETIEQVIRCALENLKECRIEEHFGSFTKNKDHSHAIDFYCKMIFYSIGRASHCIQDFYAHSNWIWLTYPSVQESIPDRSVLKKKCDLKFTQSDTKSNIIYGAKAKQVLALKSNINKLKDWRGEMEDTVGNILAVGKKITHGEMNLDHKYSWADLAFLHSWELSSGYECAFKSAKESTATFVNKFMDDKELGSIFKSIVKHYEPKEISFPMPSLLTAMSKDWIISHPAHLMYMKWCFEDMINSKG